MDDALELHYWLRKNKLSVEQVQEFTPTPMTISTCMYYTGLDYETGEPIHIPKPSEIRRQKELIINRTTMKLTGTSTIRKNDVLVVQKFR